MSGRGSLDHGVEQNCASAEEEAVGGHPSQEKCPFLFLVLEFFAVTWPWAEQEAPHLLAVRSEWEPFGSFGWGLWGETLRKTARVVQLQEQAPRSRQRIAPAAGGAPQTPGRSPLCWWL